MMGIFGSIKNAIWGSDKDKAEAKPAGPRPVPAPAPAATAAAAAPAAPDPISEAAMADRISRMAGAEKFEWRTSIVDLMKLVGVDPSFANRKELADELGMTDYTGTADQNIALHHAVLNMLAAEGGHMPDMLRD
jgi:3-oxoacyl-ACP reductase-like protein